MTLDLQEAIRSSIITEKKYMDYYQFCATQMQDPEARRIFEILAREEFEHAELFYTHYRSDDMPPLEIFFDTLPDNKAKIVSLLSQVMGADFSKKAALELAIKKENELENELLEIAGEISDAEVRAAFELNAHETHKHCLMIEAEYARIMGMVDESDMDTFVRE